MYMYVNDFHEALYLTRGTDHSGQLLQGRKHYTMTFDADDLPPVDPSRGGFWSLTMYNDDTFMLADPPYGRVDLGTFNFDANELSIVDGQLVLHLSHGQPDNPDAQANWLPAPAGPFCLAIRAYIPGDAILDGSYHFPDIIRSTP